MVANWEERNGTGEVTVHLQAGMPEGTFQADPVVVSLVGRRPGDVAVGDLNGDGRPDLAIAARDGQDALVVPQLAGGGFGTAVSVPVGGVPRAVAVADLERVARSADRKEKERPTDMFCLRGGCWGWGRLGESACVGGGGA